MLLMLDDISVSPARAPHARVVMKRKQNADGDENVLNTSRAAGSARPAGAWCMCLAKHAIALLKIRWTCHASNNRAPSRLRCIQDARVGPTR